MKIIPVNCLVTPSGEVFFIEAKLGQEYLRKVIEKWKEKNSEYNDTGTSMGVVEILMPKEKYEEISALNTIDWPQS